MLCHSFVRPSSEEHRSKAGIFENRGVEGEASLAVLIINSKTTITILLIREIIL